MVSNRLLIGTMRIIRGMPEGWPAACRRWRLGAKTFRRPRASYRKDNYTPRRMNGTPRVDGPPLLGSHRQGRCPGPRRDNRPRRKSFESRHAHRPRDRVQRTAQSIRTDATVGGDFAVGQPHLHCGQVLVRPHPQSRWSWPRASMQARVRHCVGRSHRPIWVVALNNLEPESRPSDRGTDFVDIRVGAQISADTEHDLRLDARLPEISRTQLPWRRGHGRVVHRRPERSVKAELPPQRAVGESQLHRDLRRSASQATPADVTADRTAVGQRER